MELEQFSNLWTFLVKSKNFTDFCEFNVCQICMVRVYWNSWRNFLRKVCTIFKSFRPLTEIFLIFSQKNIGSVVKTELYDSSATFSRLFWKKKCFNFFELARIIGLWAEGIKQDAWTKFSLIRERICRKIFRKNAIFFELFLSVSKNFLSFR